MRTRVLMIVFALLMSVSAISQNVISMDFKHTILGLRQGENWTESDEKVSDAKITIDVDNGYIYINQTRPYKWNVRLMIIDMQNGRDFEDYIMCYCEMESGKKCALKVNSKSSTWEFLSEDIKCLYSIY